MMLSNFKIKIIQKIENKLINNYFNNDEFIDYLINEFSQYLKILGNEAIEYLKKKYMIGKYSRNYKKRLVSYNMGKNIYKECVELYYLIITDNIINRKVNNRYVMLCNKLNKICSNFKEELPYLNYKNPKNAISNFEEIENYVIMLTSRIKQPKLLNN